MPSVSVPLMGWPRSAAMAWPPRAIFHLRRSFTAVAPLRSTTPERCDALARQAGSGGDGQSDASTLGGTVVLVGAVVCTVVVLLVVGTGAEVVVAVLEVVLVLVVGMVLDVVLVLVVGTVLEVVL